MQKQRSHNMPKENKQQQTSVTKDENRKTVVLNSVCDFPCPNTSLAPQTYALDQLANGHLQYGIPCLLQSLDENYQTFLFLIWIPRTYWAPEVNRPRLKHLPYISMY